MSRVLGWSLRYHLAVPGKRGSLPLRLAWPLFILNWLWSIATAVPGGLAAVYVIERLHLTGWAEEAAAVAVALLSILVLSAGLSLLFLPFMLLSSPCGRTTQRQQVGCSSLSPPCPLPSSPGFVPSWSTALRSAGTPSTHRPLGPGRRTEYPAVVHRVAHVEGRRGHVWKNVPAAVASSFHRWMGMPTTRSHSMSNPSARMPTASM